MKDVIQNKIYWIFILLIFASAMFLSHNSIFEVGNARLNARMGDTFALVCFWLLAVLCAVIPVAIVVAAKWFGSRWVGVVTYVPVYIASMILSGNFVNAFHSKLQQERTMNGYGNGTEDVYLKSTLVDSLLRQFYAIALFAVISLFLYFLIRKLIHAKSRG
jgi:hypothetical protein